MFDLVLGAGMPFLGPVIAAWIVLIVGVMAAYYLLMAFDPRRKDVADPPEWRRAVSDEPTGGTERRAPWVAPAHAVTPRSDVPAYDMENYPDDQWGRSSVVR